MSKSRIGRIEIQKKNKGYGRGSLNRIFSHDRKERKREELMTQIFGV